MMSDTWVSATRSCQPWVKHSHVSFHKSRQAFYYFLETLPYPALRENPGMGALPRFLASITDSR